MHKIQQEYLGGQERGGWNSVYHQKIGGKTGLGPSYFVL
jgi:hypothetical protein